MDKFLTILETPTEVKKLKKVIESKSIPLTEVILIALNPNTAAMALSLGFKTISSNEFYTNKQQQENLIKIDEISSDLQGEFDFRDQYNYCESYKRTFLVYFEVYLTHCFFIKSVCDSVLLKFPSVEKILAPSYQENPRTGQFSYNEGFVGKYLRNDSRVNLFEIDGVSVKEIRRWKLGLASCLAKIHWGTIKYLFPQKSFITTSMSYKLPLVARDNFPHKSWVYLYSLDSVLFDADHFSIKNYLKSVCYGFIAPLWKVRRNEIKISYLVDISLLLKMNPYSNTAHSTQLTQTIDKVKNSLRKNLKDLSILDSALLKVDVGISEILLRMNSVAPFLNDLLERNRPEFLMAAENLCLHSLLGEICKKKHIRGILLSHGTSPSAPDEVTKDIIGRQGKMIINGDFPYTAAQSQLSFSHLIQYGYRGEILKTGPIIWGKWAGNGVSPLAKYNIPKDKKVVLHASTNKGKNPTWSYWYETADEYVETLKSLVKIFSEENDKVLVIRLRPNDGLNELSLKILLGELKNVIICTDGNFLDILKDSDLLISFSSTTIEEAIEFEVPVLLYGGRGRMKFINSAFAINDFSTVPAKTCYWVKDESYLKFSIDEILKKSKFEKDDRSQYVIPRSERVKLSTLIEKEVK